MWTKAHMTLKRNGCSTSSAGWKSVIEFASAIEVELKEAGIDQKSFDDDQLDDKIQTILQGGSVPSSDILSKGLYSLRRDFRHDAPKSILTLLPQISQWIGREKWWFLGLMFWLAACLVRTKYQHSLGLTASIGFYGAFMAMFAAVVASSAGVNVTQRLVLLLCFGLTAVLFYLGVYLLCMIPGVVIGVRAALFGSKMGSKIVLFSLPIIINLVIALVCFIP
ncbi:uncharacterized protein BKA55DRAFT_686269 [Fusarium redolens]|uniref:Uncharacterized protein n=1 Tax=Fusarium redolens TaxID=48865 RepID=A0A9P9HNN6_FUSRE|nr:uncharacterized protein BKA55DRAFT_686269 [Fusarium redolens]KAH7260686.1 hypothetical protein BKA55DRAFT_686269 [Fusarium redolens]